MAGIFFFSLLHWDIRRPRAVHSGVSSDTDAATLLMPESRVFRVEWHPTHTHTHGLIMRVANPALSLSLPLNPNSKSSHTRNLQVSQTDLL